MLPRAAPETLRLCVAALDSPAGRFSGAHHAHDPLPDDPQDVVARIRSLQEELRHASRRGVHPPHLAYAADSYGREGA